MSRARRNASTPSASRMKNLRVAAPGSSVSGRASELTIPFFSRRLSVT